jgi:hypothetical protein
MRTLSLAVVGVFRVHHNADKNLETKLSRAHDASLSKIAGIYDQTSPLSHSLVQLLAWPSFSPSYVADVLFHFV